MDMWFVPEIHYPEQLDDSCIEPYRAQVVFVGHYEPDGRERYIRALIRAGISVRLWGGSYWTKDVLKEDFEKLTPIRLAEGSEYRRALLGGDICLCFVSKLNRDSYTRRCFEIPACKKVLISERTSELTKMFVEDQEACFFSSEEELIEKARMLIADKERREAIANAGYERVWRDRRDVLESASYWISIIMPSLNENSSKSK
jgi:hypothetical protein